MLIVLDSTSPTPYYRQIADAIKGKILTGEIGPGEPLPSIRQLAADLVTSVITTRRAYQELELEGLIQTRPGRGTFVAEAHPSALLALRLDEAERSLRDAVRGAVRLGMGGEALRGLVGRIIEEEEVEQDE